jgi:hypothetical protein
MDPIEQFLQDSYKKYKNRFLTPDELSNIKSTYGSDSKLLVTDILKKFNKPYDDDTVNKITSTYGLSTQASTTTPATQSSFSGAIDHGKVKSVIGALESDNNYSAMNRDTSARGKYQHMWSEHGSQIAQVTGIKDEATYLKTPEAQEKYQDYLQPMYEKQLPKLKKIAIEQGKDYSDEELMYLIHHSWVGNAEKFLKGQDVPDKIGLEKALAKSREQGLTTPRNVTNKLIQENTDFISVNGVLPTRAGKEFKSPVDKRMVDKLTGFMEDHGLVVTDTNDSKIHKSKDQQTGKSLDVNFDDKSINPDKVKAAVLDGQRRGLRLVYEIKDKRVYDQFIKTRPDLKDHVAYIPAATGNHFSVYHADNYDVDINLLGSSKVIPKERLQEIRIIKSKIIGASRRAGKVSDVVDANTGIAGITNKVTRLFTEEEQYRKAADDMFTSGQLNIKDFTNEELAEIYNFKSEIVDMEKQSKIARQRVKDQLADKGILEGVGDFFAGTMLDQIAGIGSADRLDTKDGKININYKNIDKNSFFDNTSKYLSPEEILNLTAHPEAKDPKNPNDPKNKALRGIQKILIAGDSLEFDAKTKADSIRRELSAGRLQTLEKEITKVGGKDALTTLSTLSKKYEDGSITEEESQQLQALQQKLENSGGLLTQYGQNVQQYNTSNEAIKSLQGKYGIVTKLRLRDDEYQKQADAYDKKLGFWGKKERSVSNILSAFGNGIMDIPGAVVNFAGIGIEAATGLDLGTSDAAKARNRSKVDYIASTDRKRGVLETTMNVDGYEVVFENNKATAVYDSKGYKVEDSIAESIGAKAQEKLNTDYEGKQAKLDWLDNTSFNFSALQQGAEDTAPQLLEIVLIGNVMKAGAMVATKILAKTATSGSKVANAARILSKPLQSARGIESAAMVPVFVKDTVDGAINDGAITPTQIFGTATTKLGMEAVAESMFAGPIGKMLSGKGITQTVFSKGLAEKLNDVVRHYATGKITSRDFMNHLGRAAKELVKDSGGEFVEEAFIEWTNGAVNEFLNSQLGTNYDEQTASAKEVFSAGLIGLAAGGVMSGPRVLAGIADYKSNIQQSYQNLLSDVVGQTSASLVRGETVANPEAFKEYLSQAVQDGQIDQKDADKYSAAIQSAANRTKFTNDIDVSTGAFKDLRDNRGLEARESFINLVRNTAFNKALTESIDDTNQFAQEEQSAKVQQYENVIKELELNAHKAIYSSATPTIIGLQRGLNPSQISELRNKQAKVLEEVNATKLNAVNKAKAVELKLNDAANTILKSKENISDKEKAKLEEIDKQIKTVTEDLNKTNTEEAAKAAVSANTATPEQVQAELIKAKQSVDDLFTGQKTLKDNELPDFSIDLVQQLLENTPDMLKGEVSKYIDKKLEAINAQAYRQQVQNLNEQEKTAKPTSSVKLSPAAAFETRYNGNIELETTEGDTFRKDYISKIETERNDAFTRGEADILTVLDDDLIAFESITSFRDAYINDPKFREFVDANTNAVASKPNTIITQEQKQAETDEKAKKEAKKQQEIAKKQENIKDVAKDKELYEAAKIIVEKQYASQAFLVKELGITNEKAKELLQRLEAIGVIGPNKVGKTRDIYIDSIEEFNTLVPPASQSGVANTATANTSGSSVSDIESKKADIERRRQEELIANIYTQLGDKTVSGNVTLKSVYQQAGIDFAKSIGGIFSLRVTNSNKHFGNPFSSVPSEIAKGLIATKSTKESVEKYIDWVLFSNEERAKWIREQLKSGNLKNKPIIYYKELGEPSHATALDYLINAKYDAELAALEQPIQPTPVQQEQKTPVVSGRIEVTANGYGALNIADNLLVTDYLKAGDPVFYELSAKSTDAKPVIEKVVYYKDKSFGQPTTKSKRIILQVGFGLDEYKLTKRFADEIKAGKERVETKATYVNFNKTKKLTPDNKKQLSIEEVEAIKPYLYVVGKSFSSDENIVLLNSEKDGENFLSVSDFISDLKDKHPDLKNFQEVENILRHKDVNGKVVFIKGNTIIPLDTITNEDYAPNKEFITEFLDKLSSEATGMADWRIDIDGRFLGDAVKKRSDVKDYTNETSPNFRGRLIEYFASGPQHRQANPTELLYKIKYNEEEGKSEPIYLTKEQALEELLAIRVNIDHADLRAENSSKGLDGLLADVLRVPAMPAKGFTDLYNVVGLEDIDGGSTDTIKLESEEVVTLEEKETTKTTSLKELKTGEPKKEGPKERKGGKKIDFKISDAEYNGKVEEAVAYIKTRFKEIGVEINDKVLENLVKGTAAEGSKVWGAFHNAMVTLSSLSNEKVARHESMHVVFKMFLNKQQQIDVLNELWNKFKNSPKYKDKEQQFKNEMQEFLTSDNFDTKKDFKLTDQEQVNYALKAVDILQSDKAKQVFEKGKKANWDLNKILTELQVPKEQKQLILDLGISDREQLALELASNYSYAVEIITTKKQEVLNNKTDGFVLNNKYYTHGFDSNGNQSYEVANIIDSENFQMWEPDTYDEFVEISKEDYLKAREQTGENTQHYSNLTVPGGTNYTENEISTPAITPSIKGHAQFATDNGIGWFRSDDKTELTGNITESNRKAANAFDLEPEPDEKVTTKTRRILEVQSDLFQKGRDKKQLSEKGKYGSIESKIDKSWYYNLEDSSFYKDSWLVSDENVPANIKQELIGQSSNQFLQLLNKDNNWVTFFVKSIIQDSAKKGYEKVLFPTGNTASKVEGHTTLEEFKREKEDRIKELENDKQSILNGKSRRYKDIWFDKNNLIIDDSKVSEFVFSEKLNQVFDIEVNQLKQELERVETEGFGALKPIYNFYENTVTNILNKTYGKENIKVITDEYGNTWNEIIINNTRDTSNILLKSTSEQFYSEQSILTQLQEDLSDAFEDYKNTLLLPEGFSKKYPTISKFIENLFNFLKKNYLIGKSYITNKKSIDQLFYEVENNILGRDFIGRRKKSVGDVFNKAVNNLSQKDKPDFKISDWDNAEANKFANFLATDIFTKYLESTYRNSSVNEIIADNKDLSIETVINKFSSNLEQTLNKYKDAVVKREELEISSDEYQILEATLNDIYKQYASKDANKAFKQFVNKKLGNRYAGVVEFDKLESDDLLVDDENIKEVDEVEESQAESWQTKAGKIDAKTKSSARLREFFSSIPLRTRLVRNDKSERSTITDEDLFSTLYYSGEYIHNKLLLELSDNSNYEDFIKAVNGLVKKHQFGADILAAIMNLTEEQLVEAYDNNSLELPLDVFTNPQAYGDYKLWILKDMYYAIGDQSNLQPIKTLTKNKGEQTTDAQIGLSVQDTDYDNATRTIKESVDNILTDTSKRESFKALLEETITAINEKGKVAGLIIKVFSKMGYQVSDELLLNLQPTSSINGEEDNLTYLKKGLTSIVNDINDNNKTVIDVTGRGVDIPAKLISTYSTVSSGLSYMNVEGENEFAHQNSNHLSRVGAIWAKGANAMKQWVNNMRYVDGDPNKAIVLQSHLPIYEDMLDTANTFRIYQDGGTQVEGQTNSGKAYADMTFAELTAHSINLYLTKNNQKNAGNTIKKLHALFHVMVFSDSPKRQMLHAPTYNGDTGHNRIIDKLINIVYGELERVGYAKAQENSSISELEKLSVAGKLIHTIPQLNDVKIKINGKYMPFVEFFATNLWTNPNSAIQISNVTTYKGIDKQGNTFESSLSGNTHRAMVSQIIKETLAKDYQHYIDTIYTSDVKKLVTSSATDSDIKDFYYNSYYYNISAGIMFSGDPAHYKLKNDSTNIERVKRDKQNVAPNIHLAFEKPTYDVIILKDVKANTSNVGNKEVAADLADASAWHTLDRRIEILKASPDWELRKNELLPALEAIQNNKYTQKDLQTVHLQLLKPFVYAQVNKELPVGKDVTAYFKLPIQLKNAEAVLLPTEAYRVYGNSESYVRPESLADITADKYYSPELARTLFLMEKANVGTVVFESGSKGEIFGKVNLETYTEADIINMNTDKTRATTILTLKNSDWGLQMEVPRKDLQAKVGQGSQEHKIMSANVDENWTFTVANKTFSGQEGANDLLQQIQTLYAKENLTKVLKEIANEDGTLNIKEVLSIVSDTLIEKFTNIDTIEGLELQTDGKTLTPLELFGKKAEKVLNSLFKAVSKIKGSGAALVNKTSVGYVRDVEYDGKKGQLTPSNDLKLVRDKDGNILYYEAIVPVYDPIIYQFIDNNGELLLDENNNPLIPEKLLYSFFYRIPTEDKYSMFPIKIKKFSMPVEGGGIILPREATQTAGLDFDIDKLYGYYYNFKVNYPPEFRNFVINKFNKSTGLDSAKYFDALEDNTIALDFTDTELVIVNILKNSIETYKKDYEKLNNKFLTNTKDFIKLVESNLKDSKSAHNLKLDVYFSLVNTKAYTRDALTPGNKNRLEALRDELAGSQYQAKYSYGDPSFIAKSANKNIVGKRLIGIFANGNSFYNLIQGATKITLKNPIKFIANGVKYSFDSIGGINHQISKNIAELLFASTEDVKDPVLEPLNINTHTAPLLVTLLSMTNGTDIIKFEDAVKLLSDQSIIDAVKKAESEGKKFTNVYPRDGKYHKLIQMSEKYNAIVSASKIDQAIGPDFFTVQSKISNIDNIITDSIDKENYPFTSESVKSILPSSNNISKIKQLNVYREALDEELKLFKDVFSFLKDKVLSTLDILEERSKTGKLAPAKKYDIAYYMYDAAIQNIYGETLVKELTENFPTKLFNYNYPGNTGILKQAFEIDKKGIVKMRWVNTNATNILEQYKEAFSDLFTLDPTMAEELAAYAFLTGTKFKMDSIVKIVPNEFYKEGVGKKIRDIINGNTLEDNLLENIADVIMVNHYKLILPKEEMTINGNTATLKNESFSDPKPFLWSDQGTVDFIYEHTGDGIYKYYAVEKTKFPNYLINVKKNTTFAVNNDVTSVTTQSSTSINPLVAAGVKPTDMYGNAAKDIQMAEESTQFIGFQSGTAAVSSTDKYREAWGDKANTGNYSKNDVIMVSGSGLFRGVTEAQIKEVLTNKYKPLLDQAIAAGASFRVGNQYNKGNLSDQLIAEYLKAKGYVEEYLNGYSRWSSSSNTQSDSPLNGDDITPCTKIK